MKGRANERLYFGDELLELYPFDPDCEGCSVPYPIVRQNILDMPAADVIKRTAAVGAVLGLTITDERIVPYAKYGFA